MGVLKGLYNWTEGLTKKKGSIYYLAAIAFIESSLFPIPPDVMLLPMSYFNNKKAIKYAFITTFASVIGGVLGYLIGIFINKEIIPPKLVIGTVISEMTFYKVRDLYRENVFLAIFVSALTPIPYKAFTIAGGYFQVALLPFILGSFLGRGMRFFSEALLFYVFGPTIKPFVDKNFEKLTILIALLIILFFAILKWIS